VLLGLLAGQLMEPRHRGRGRRLQRIEFLAGHDPLAVGQGRQHVHCLCVADALSAQLMGGALGVFPEHGDDQVLGAGVGGARLDGDAEGLVDDEPQAADEVGLRYWGGRLGVAIGRQQPGIELPGLLGGQAAGAQQRRAAGVLVIPLPEDRGQQQIRRAGRWVPAVACQRPGGAQGVARLLADRRASHDASFGHRAEASTALSTLVARW
jgi:hypothetical protein